MKKLLLLHGMLLCAGATFAIKDTIRSVNVGAPAFDPDGLTLNSGDTLVFDLISEHDAIEISQENWNTNTPTRLPGGFAIPYGGGEIVPIPGIHYYICEAHADMGMKGTFTVSDAPAGLGTILLKNLVVYPNPAKETIYLHGIKNGTPVHYSLSDLTGKELRMYAGTVGPLTLPIGVADLPRGMYVLTIVNEEAVSKTPVLLE